MEAKRLHSQHKTILACIKGDTWISICGSISLSPNISPDFCSV